MADRLHKVLAHYGIASRRGAEAMIAAGRVRVNGAIAQPGQSVDPDRDRILVDGQDLRPPQRPPLRHILLHKPLGVVSTCQDPQGRPTVLDCLPPALRQGQGLHPVGRLDVQSTGALLITNDGDLTLRLTHPRHPIAKTYQVWVQGHPSPQVLEQWRSGILLDGKPTLPAQVRPLKRTPHSTHLEIQLREGRNRQIRRMAEQLGHPVERLHRSAIGSIVVAPLKPGQWRFLQPPDLAALR